MHPLHFFAPPGFIIHRGCTLKQSMQIMCHVSTMWKGVFKEKTSVQNDNVTFMLKGIYIQGKKNQNSTIVRNEIIMIT